MYNKWRAALPFALTQFAAGRQAYLVFPRVGESEVLDVSAVTVEFGKWRKRLAPHVVDLLHGRVPAEEKEAPPAASPLKSSPRIPH